MWMCTPLPTPAGSRIGVKVTSSPKRPAVMRVSSRRITAASAARRPRSGPFVTSYWLTPYSFMKVSGNQPAHLKCRYQRLAELPALDEPGQRIGLAAPKLRRLELELVLEGGEEFDPADLLEPRQRMP